MKFLLSWLREFIELSLPPQTLAERLTMAGLEVASLTRSDGDWLFDAEVTPNRPDLLSHLGIARETAAVLGRPFRFPRWLRRATQPLPGGGSAPPVTIEDAEGCRRYAGIVIDGVQIRPSPPEMQERLTRLGIRPVNNVVDVTNLCLLELGQPLHAFDLDRLEGGALRVRRARAGEQLTTLDGETKALSPELLVIADEKRPVALAGLMGGSGTEISPRTRRVFLESAWFDPARICKAGRIFRLSSESSCRFERGVDPEMVPVAAIRAARWIEGLSRGRIRGMTSAGAKEPARRILSLRGKKAQEMLGIRCTVAQQRRFLERLGCRVTGAGRGLRVEPPSWRRDLQIPEDLVEEVARLWGYDRCPETLPPAFRKGLADHPWRPAVDPTLSLADRIRGYLTAAGFQEISTYSLVNPADHRRIRCGGAAPLELANPLSMEYSVLRASLLVGALQTVARNLNRKAAGRFELFEIGAVYGREADPAPGAAPTERTKIGLLAGEALRLKGAVGFLLERLRVQAEAAVQNAPAGPLRDSSILFRSGGELLGAAGAVSTEVLEAYEIPPEFPVAYAELDLAAIAQAAAAAPELAVSPLPTGPPVVRDLAIVLAEEVPFGPVHRLIQETGRPLLESAVLFDLYRGKQVPAGKKGLAFRLILSAGDRTLTEAEISGSCRRILQALEKRFGAVLR